MHIIPERVTRIPEDEADNLLGLWRSTVLGRTALISSENEEAWRNTLRKICAKIVQRGQARVRALVELLRGPNVPDWWEGSKTNVQSLWEEEVEVASVVQKSVDEGIEF